MGVRSPYGFSNARKLLSKNGITNDTVILRRLSKIGEDMCSHARRNKGGHPLEYEDQTHNLRSSIAYRIYFNGKIEAEGGYQNISSGNGMEEAKQALDEYGLAYASNVEGWVLIIVAGEHYARYVEAKGYNVLHLTNIELQQKVELLKEELGLK